MQRMSFALWLENQKPLEEVRRLAARPEDLGQKDQIRNLIQVGDIVQMGVETQYKGAATPKYGKVAEITARGIVVQPFLGQKPVTMPLKDLHMVDPNEEIPQEQEHIMKDLSRLGAQHLWVKASERQKGKIDRQKSREAGEREARSAQLAMPDTSRVDKSDIARIRQLLMGDMPSDPSPTSPAPKGGGLAGLFNEPEPSKPKFTSPLAARLQTRKGGTPSGSSVADRFAMI
jgi:hypothetical protein